MLLPLGIMAYVSSWNKLRKTEAHHKDEKVGREREKDWAQPIITCSLSQSYRKGDHLHSCSFQAIGLLRTLFQRIIFYLSNENFRDFSTFFSGLSPQLYLSNLISPFLEFLLQWIHFVGLEYLPFHTFLLVVIWFSLILIKSTYFWCQKYLFKLHFISKL